MMPSAPQPVPTNMCRIDVITYVGNGGSNLAVAHSLKKKPRFIGISNIFFEIEPCTKIHGLKSQALGRISTVTEATTTHFYVGDASYSADSANSNGVTYYAVVIG